MKSPSAYRLLVPVLAVATAWAAWRVIPGTAIDRLFFTATSITRAKPPLLVTGAGGHSAPWVFRCFAASRPPGREDAPVIVALGDDTDGFFQSSPASPVDLAVILTNMHRLGARKAATAAVLAWNDPDPIGLAALDLALARFDSLVMAAPLWRAAVPELIPPAFRNASLPVTAADGDVSALPIVNRIPVSGVILGGDNSRAGFQTLDSDKPGQPSPLIARWDDRLVFAFPVIAALDRLGLPIEGMEIQIGKFLSLGPDGPAVPIDAFGRLAVPARELAAMAELPAESLIDAEPGVFPGNTRPPVILADHRSAAEASTRAFSQQLPFLVATLASDKALGPARVHPRLAAHWEFLILLAFSLVASACARLPSFTRRLSLLLAVMAVFAAQLSAAALFGVWLPGLAALAATAMAFAATCRRRSRS